MFMLGFGAYAEHLSLYKGIWVAFYLVFFSLLFCFTLTWRLEFGGKKSKGVQVFLLIWQCVEMALCILGLPHIGQWLSGDAFLNCLVVYLLDFWIWTIWFPLDADSLLKSSPHRSLPLELSCSPSSPLGDKTMNLTLTGSLYCMIHIWSMEGMLTCLLPWKLRECRATILCHFSFT